MSAADITLSAAELAKRRKWLRTDPGAPVVMRIPVFDKRPVGSRPDVKAKIAKANAARRAAEPKQAKKARMELQKEARRVLVLHHANLRRAAKLKRTPAWSDLTAILAMYEKARAMSLATGVEHHVDHEIPLQGERVSGLHVPANLQILTGSENSRKRNKYEVE